MTADSPARPDARWPSWLPIALILALATALRLYHLGTESFWIDEIFSLTQAESPQDAIDGYWDFGNRDTSRPLALTLLHYVLFLGDSEFLTRLPYAILSILDVGALYLLSKELAGRRIALRAALFLAVLPLHVWYAQEVRWYAQWAFLSTLTFLAMVRLWKTGRNGWWLAHGAALVLALYTYVVSILLLVVQAVAGWLLPDHGRRASFRAKILTTTVVTCLLALPIVLVTMGVRVQGPGEMVGTPRPTTLVVLPYLFFAYVAGYTIGPTVAELHDLPSPGSILAEYPEVVLYYVVFMPIAALGLWSFRERRAAGAILGPWVAGLPLLVFASAVLAGQTFNVRYTFAAVPGFALLLSLGVESLGRWRQAGMAAALILFGWSLLNFYTDPRYDKENTRGAIQHVRASPYRDEPVVVVGQGLAAAAHYGEGLELYRLVGCGGERGGGRDGAPDIHLPELRREPLFWLLVSRDWRGRSDRCADSMAQSHVIRERTDLSGVDLLLLRQR